MVLDEMQLPSEVPAGTSVIGAKAPELSAAPSGS